jgi:soluble lytic murein transglycosylase-like protein
MGRLPAWVRVPCSPWARAGVLLVLAGLVTGLSIGLWPAARALAVEVNDQLGLRQVEGHAELIAEAAAESQVDPLLIAAIMFMESRGRAGQTSSAGAHGLMQLVPAAADDASRRLGIPAPTVEHLRDGERINIRLGAAHLAWLLENRGEWNLEAVLVSYNAGRAKLFRWIDRHGSYRAWREYEFDRHAAGEKTTGTLEYATKTLAVMEVLRERGLILPVPGVEPVDFEWPE